MEQNERNVAVTPPPSVLGSEKGRSPCVDQTDTVVVRGLEFSYPGIDGQPLPGLPPILRCINFSLKAGNRLLLVGPNGAGKTTLLKILGGKHMVPKSAVSVLGHPPFHDTQLTISGDLSYIGGAWERDIAFAGYSVPLQGDILASQIINNIPGVDSKRKDHLMHVLDVNPNWRMHLVSDGQRRRVQLCVGLLKPFKVLLLDEITVDLDILGRADLMAFLQQECKDRNATIIYATHIFDGLESWPTHIAFLSGGTLKVFEAADDIPELKNGSLLKLVVKWLLEERRSKETKTEEEVGHGAISNWLELANNGWISGRMTSSLAPASKQ